MKVKFTVASNDVNKPQKIHVKRKNTDRKNIYPVIPYV